MDTIKKIINDADSLLSFLHYRGYINYQKNGCPEKREVEQLIGELRKANNELTG